MRNGDGGVYTRVFTAKAGSLGLGRRGKRALGALLTTAFVAVNVIFPHRVEADFWMERGGAARRARSACAVAALPRATGSASLFPPSSPFPAFSSRAAELPRDLLASHGTLLAALPLGAGTARRASIPARHDGRVVIHLQDVHRNIGAQKNLARAVAALAPHAGLVGLEGTDQPVDLARFRTFEDREAVRHAADFLLKEHRISGPVHAAFTGPPSMPPFLGMEDKALYDANLEAYRRAAPALAETRLALGKIQSDIARQKRAVYNAALLDLDSAVARHRAGQGTLGDYLQTLSRAAPRAPAGAVREFLAALAMERTLDFGKVEDERRRVMERLATVLPPEDLQYLANLSWAFRLGELGPGEFYRAFGALCQKASVAIAATPAFDAYVRYTLLAGRLSIESIMEEADTLERAAFQSLAKTEKERALISRDRAVTLGDKLLAFSLTPPEWEEYEALVQTRGRPLICEGAESFYRAAQERDRVMARNLLAAMDARGARSAVLVAGGYHQSGVARELGRAGVAVVSFTPRVESLDGPQGAEYLSLFSQEKTPLENLFTGKKLFLAENPNQSEFAWPMTIASALAKTPRHAHGGFLQRAREQLAPNMSKAIKLSANIQRKSTEFHIRLLGQLGSIQESFETVCGSDGDIRSFYVNSLNKVSFFNRLNQRIQALAKIAIVLASIIAPPPLAYGNYGWGIPHFQVSPPAYASVSPPSAAGPEASQSVNSLDESVIWNEVLVTKGFTPEEAEIIIAEQRLLVERLFPTADPANVKTILDRIAPLNRLDESDPIGLGDPTKIEIPRRSSLTNEYWFQAVIVQRTALALLSTSGASPQAEPHVQLAANAMGYQRFLETARRGPLAQDGHYVVKGLNIQVGWATPATIAYLQTSRDLGKDPWVYLSEVARGRATVEPVPWSVRLNPSDIPNLWLINTVIAFALPFLIALFWGIMKISRFDRYLLAQPNLSRHRCAKCHELLDWTFNAMEILDTLARKEDTNLREALSPIWPEEVTWPGIADNVWNSSEISREKKPYRALVALTIALVIGFKLEKEDPLYQHHPLIPRTFVLPGDGNPPDVVEIIGWSEEGWIGRSLSSGQKVLLSKKVLKNAHKATSGFIDNHFPWYRALLVRRLLPIQNKWAMEFSLVFENGKRFWFRAGRDKKPTFEYWNGSKWASATPDFIERFLIPSAQERVKALRRVLSSATSNVTPATLRASLINIKNARYSMRYPSIHRLITRVEETVMACYAANNPPEDNDPDFQSLAMEALGAAFRKRAEKYEVLRTAAEKFIADRLARMESAALPTLPSPGGTSAFAEAPLAEDTADLPASAEAPPQAIASPNPPNEKNDPVDRKKGVLLLALFLVPFLLPFDSFARYEGMTKEQRRAASYAQFITPDKDSAPLTELVGILESNGFRAAQAELIQFEQARLFDLVFDATAQDRRDSLLGLARITGLDNGDQTGLGDPSKGILIPDLDDIKSPHWKVATVVERTARFLFKEQAATPAVGAMGLLRFVESAERRTGEVIPGEGEYSSIGSRWGLSWVNEKSKAMLRLAWKAGDTPEARWGYLANQARNPTPVRIENEEGLSQYNPMRLVILWGVFLVVLSIGAFIFRRAHKRAENKPHIIKAAPSTSPLKKGIDGLVRFLVEGAYHFPLIGILDYKARTNFWPDASKHALVWTFAAAPFWVLSWAVGTPELGPFFAEWGMTSPRALFLLALAGSLAWGAAGSPLFAAIHTQAEPRHRPILQGLGFLFNTTAVFPIAITLTGLPVPWVGTVTLIESLAIGFLAARAADLFYNAFAWIWNKAVGHSKTLRGRTLPYASAQLDSVDKNGVIAIIQRVLENGSASEEDCAKINVFLSLKKVSIYTETGEITFVSVNFQSEGSPTVTVNIAEKGIKNTTSTRMETRNSKTEVRGSLTRILTSLGGTATKRAEDSAREGSETESAPVVPPPRTDSNPMTDEEAISFMEELADGRTPLQLHIEMARFNAWLNIKPRSFSDNKGKFLTILLLSFYPNNVLSVTVREGNSASTANLFYGSTKKSLEALAECTKKPSPSAAPMTTIAGTAKGESTQTLHRAALMKKAKKGPIAIPPFSIADHTADQFRKWGIPADIIQQVNAMDPAIRQQSIISAYLAKGRGPMSKTIPFAWKKPDPSAPIAVLHEVDHVETILNSPFGKGLPFFERISRVKNLNEFIVVKRRWQGLKGLENKPSNRPLIIEAMQTIELAVKLALIKAIKGLLNSSDRETQVQKIKEIDKWARILHDEMRWEETYRDRLFGKPSTRTNPTSLRAVANERPFFLALEHSRQQMTSADNGRLPEAAKTDKGLLSGPLMEHLRLEEELLGLVGDDRVTLDNSFVVLDLVTKHPLLRIPLSTNDPTKHREEVLSLAERVMVARRELLNAVFSYYRTQTPETARELVHKMSLFILLPWDASFKQSNALEELTELFKGFVNEEGELLSNLPDNLRFHVAMQRILGRISFSDLGDQVRRYSSEDFSGLTISPYAWKTFPRTPAPNSWFYLLSRDVRWGAGGFGLETAFIGGLLWAWGSWAVFPFLAGLTFVHGVAERDDRSALGTLGAVVLRMGIFSAYLVFPFSLAAATHGIWDVGMVLWERSQVASAARWVAKAQQGITYSPPPALAASVLAHIFPARSLELSRLDSRGVGRRAWRERDLFFDQLNEALGDERDAGRLAEALSALAAGRPARMDATPVHMSFVGESGIPAARDLAEAVKKLNSGEQPAMKLFLVAGSRRTYDELKDLSLGQEDSIHVLAAGTEGTIELKKVERAFLDWVGGSAVTLSMSRSSGLTLVGDFKSRLMVEAFEVLKKLPLGPTNFENLLRAAKKLAEAA